MTNHSIYAPAIATRRRRTAAKLRRGFTLVEMLVVVAIISLLAAIVIPNYLHSREVSAVATSKGDLKQVSTALELYRNDNNGNLPANGTVNSALFSKGVNPSSDYLQATPSSPGGGGAYTYATDGAGNYTITDPTVYQTGDLIGIEKATAAGGAVTDSGAACTATCTHLGYSNETGPYGN